MILAHRIALDLNNKQKTYMQKACGTARFAYNWALARWEELYEQGEKVSEGRLRKELNAIKRQSYPWMLEVTKCAPQLAIMDLGQAFQNFFDGRAGRPRFKKKGVHNSFSISNDQFTVSGKNIHIPRLGLVRMREALRFQGKIMGATISLTGDRWYAAIQVERSEPKPIHTGENQAVGIDLGVRNLATLSTGETIPGPKALTRLLKDVQRTSRSLSRKVGSKKGEAKSKNYLKELHKLRRLHARIAHIREDALHKLTTRLSGEYAVIGIEDLRVQEMQRKKGSKGLRRTISDMSFFEFRRQLEYKAKMTGSKVVVAGQYYPSSKLCSVCGYRLDQLSLDIRSWQCPVCGVSHDRDVNAAVNLRHMAVSSTVTACGAV